MKLPSYYLVTILLTGGHTIKIKCKSYSFTRSTVEGGGYTAYNFTGLKEGENFGFNFKDMVGFTAVEKTGSV